jgi:hypothetical protein
MDHQAVVEQTRRWIAEVVIGLNLCPFARRVFEGELIRYVVTDAPGGKAVRAVLRAELNALAAAGGDCVETTFLIHPQAFRDFLRFNDFLGDCEQLLADQGLQGTIQLVGFHPEYQFVDTHVDAPENFTNRAPYPMLQLLREASISAAASSPDNLLDIPRRNVATLRALGAARLRAQLAALARGPAGGTGPGKMNGP